MRLTPRSAKDAIGGRWQDDKGACWLQVAVRAVPEKGRANQALIRLIARRLSLAAQSVTIESGALARLKRVRLSGQAAHIETITQELDRP